MGHAVSRNDLDMLAVAELNFVFVNRQMLKTLHKSFALGISRAPLISSGAK